MVISIHGTRYSSAAKHRHDVHIAAMGRRLAERESIHGNQRRVREEIRNSTQAGKGISSKKIAP
ncbi:hypothetical protein K5D56_04700 [Pseudomonas cichorii]|uniref:Uncharacterized protein n=1 Tax=Pseudomonas lijiangensis TaxID=2995658 RepID=A0ABX8HVR0_9PSED|nr:MULTISPECIES: hypothetical protein [Pseudomonas syringae group]MBX8490545.1 hypothetical protein [Pseudomonas cichorii]MBX8499049.1 hypothetical protein [Pseudomonas lijiangensis]MBX8504082.1 hypothetical protein [Pseudomonas lijiangensis]MBX8522439.1 hypothetical protein [Pseudomonas cichorii]MBX8540862.1 hypothetical protein [Pseudomonas cichorii]